jgi:hypothetical protein
VGLGILANEVDRLLAKLRFIGNPVGHIIEVKGLGVDFARINANRQMQTASK